MQQPEMVKSPAVVVISLSAFVAVAVAYGGEPCPFLEIAGKVGVALEVKSVGDVADRQVGVGQIGLYLCDGVVVNEFFGGMPDVFLT